VADAADVAVVQSVARSFGAAAGLGSQDQWALATAATEAATNILKFSGHGWVTFRVLADPSGVVEFHAVDVGPTGPGLADGVVPVASPASRGLGCGLGAIQRLMDQTAVENLPGGGFSVTARKRVRTGDPP
jgi:anti-sigma regulatory factor (Ser/Thr protein kinase)